VKGDHVAAPFGKCVPERNPDTAALAAVSDLQPVLIEQAVKPLDPVAVVPDDPDVLGQDAEEIPGAPEAVVVGPVQLHDDLV